MKHENAPLLVSIRMPAFLDDQIFRKYRLCDDDKYYAGMGRFYAIEVVNLMTPNSFAGSNSDGVCERLKG
ncbi:TPA: hypothetical protein ACVO12_004304 [Vibrio diabolicus]